MVQRYPANCNLLECWNSRQRDSAAGWDEGTTSDLLGEVLHVYPAHVKKALALARLARTDGCETLSYLLELATIEAELMGGLPEGQSLS